MQRTLVIGKASFVFENISFKHAWTWTETGAGVSEILQYFQKKYYLKEHTFFSD